MRATLVCVFLLAACLAPTSLAQDDTRMKRWLEQVLNGDQAEADEAADRIINKLTDPLAEALGSVENRPAEEQRRIRALASRLTGALRARLYRLDLPPGDRTLMDTFAAQYPELTRRLFEADARERLSALRQVPLEKDTGAGVLIAARLDDDTAEVVDAAIDAAGRLKDAVVTRGLVRFLDSAVDALEHERYGPDQDDIEIALTSFCSKTIIVLGRCQATAAVPNICHAVTFFSRSPLKTFFQTGDVALVLGDLGDERAVPTLLSLLSNREFRGNMPNPNGKLIIQTEGDAALLALLRIYKLDPATFGLRMNPTDPHAGGFEEEAPRTAAERQFRTWYKENADRPADKRSKPTSQPTSAP